MNEPLLKKKPFFAEKVKTLKRLNLGAGLLHGVNFIVAAVLIGIYNNRSIVTTITTDFRFSLRQQSVYQLLWVELPFSAVTCLFHLYLSLASEQQTHYAEYVFIKGKNPYRWIEYGITASLMTWVILQIAGVTNVFLLIMVGIIANMVLQYQGYLMESMNPPKRDATAWGPMISGWLLFAGQWAVILSYFFDQVTSTTSPWWVYTIVIGCFAQFCLFGIVQLMQYNGQTTYWAEIAYITLSYTSKFYLNWNLVIAMLTG